MNLFSIKKWSKNDLKDFVSLRKTIVNECPYMLLTPEEVSDAVDQQEQSASSILESPSKLLLGAWNDQNKPVGFILLSRHTNQKSQHRISIVIGTIREVYGKGAAYQLFESGLEWAKSNQAIRLDLTVAVENKRAVCFYQKLGFKIEGILSKTLRQTQDLYTDEYSMSLIL